MEDSKHTIFKVRDVFIILAVIGLFVGLYYFWFGCISGRPVESKQITFSIITRPVIPDSTSQIANQVILNENQKQIDSLRSILAQICNENSRINEKIDKCEYLNVSNLSAFYASLFTVIAVIVAIAGLIGWRFVSGYKKDMEQGISEVKKIKLDIDKQTEETKKIFERERNKSDLVAWTEEKFQELANKNLTSLPKTQKTTNKLNEIKNYVISEFTTDSKLETFYAYHLAFTNKKYPEHLNKAEKILNSILDRDLLEDVRLKGQILHILGQINFEQYLLKSKKCNLFKSSDKDLIRLHRINIEEAIRVLEASANNYKKSFETKEKSEPVGIDETRGNLAMVLIELHKYTIAHRDEEKLINTLNIVKVELFEDIDTYHVTEQDFLTRAQQYQKKIEEKSFNQLWDDARRIYYENKFEERIETARWTSEDERIWVNNIHNALVSCIEREIKWTDPAKRWKMEDREFFSKQLKKEILEFNEIGKKGFPGKKEFITEIDEMLTKK